MLQNVCRVTLLLVARLDGVGLLVCVENHDQERLSAVPCGGVRIQSTHLSAAGSRPLSKLDAGAAGDRYLGRITH
jgi:hypothetical protein